MRGASIQVTSICIFFFLLDVNLHAGSPRASTQHELRVGVCEYAKIPANNLFIILSHYGLVCGGPTCLQWNVIYSLSSVVYGLAVDGQRAK